MAANAAEPAGARRPEYNQSSEGSNLKRALRSSHKLLTALRLAWSALAGDERQRARARYQIELARRRINVGFMTVEELGLSPERATPHGNSGGPDLEIVLKALPITPRDSILDIGCGKGGAMITFARSAFAKVDGIEICPNLAKIAQRNLKRLGCERGTIRLGDAAEFKDFDGYTFLYLFHPFTDVVMRSVLENLRSSLSRVPRRLTLIYKNPACHDLLVDAGFRQVRQFEHADFRVYEIVPDVEGSRRAPAS